MKKSVLAMMVLAFFSVISFSVSACPKGSHLEGGVGPHHKGGHCVKK